MKTKSIIIFPMILIAFLLSSCVNGSGNGPGTVVEQYFQAIADGDENRIATISCPDWENGAQADVAAFIGVEASLEDVTCQPLSENSSEAVVECTGAIVATYNNEDTSFELKDKQLKVINMNGEWLVCGYAE